MWTVDRYRSLVFVSLAAIASVLGNAGAAAAPAPVGLWEFDDPGNPLEASVGRALLLVGAHELVSGPGHAGHALRIGTGSYLACAHGIEPGEEQEKVNEYTLLIDFRAPLEKRFTAVYQTDPSNRESNVCEILNREGVAGIPDTGFSDAGAVQRNAWMRMAIAVDNAAGRYDIYINGERVLHGAPQPVDGRYALDPVLLFFTDAGDHDSEVEVARLAIYSSALTSADIAALGGPVPAGAPNRAPRVAAVELPHVLQTGAPAQVSVRASDPDEGDLVQFRIDWGGGAVTEWSPLQDADESFNAEYMYALPGRHTIRAQVRDPHGAASEWHSAGEVSVEGEAKVAFLTPPFLQNLSETGITIMWETNAPLDYEVRYHAEGGTALVCPAARDYTGHGTHIYKAELTGLEPGTDYQYQIAAGGAVVTPDAEPAAHPLRFRTAPAAFEPFAFGVWADSQGYNRGAYPDDPFEPTKIMMAHMAESGVAFGVGAGDHAEAGEKYEDTRQFYLDRVARYLGTKAPYFIAWGNHDSYPGAMIRRFADMPSKDRPGLSPGYGSFSFNYANCHFVCIDYARMMPDIRHWLENDLKDARARGVRHIFLFIHVPPYCELWIDGSQRLRDELVPLLEQYEVDAVFSGHTHEYERGFKNGVFYCITGGGSWLDHGEPIVKEWPFITVGGANDLPGRQHGLVNEYVRVAVDEDGWSAEMAAFEPDGTEIGVLDTFSSHDRGQLAREQRPVVHTVFFWLKDGVSADQKAEMIAAMETLRAIDGVDALYAGTPIPSDRPIVDTSYDASLTVVFRDARALDAYLPDPVHQEFVQAYSALWDRVLVYDAQ